MAVIALFDMQVQPEFAPAGLDHVIVVEQWQTESHDVAYQAWRAGDGLPTDIIAMLARPATTAHFTISLDL